VTEDFVSRLRLQIREAAEREERCQGLTGRIAAARPLPPRIALDRVVSALIVVLIIAAAVYALATLRPEPAAPPPWKVITRLAPGGSLGAIAGGFGSAWVDDTTRGQLLRIDPRSHTITARVAVRGSAAVSVGAGAVWVVESSSPAYELTGPLLRIDPRTNHVVARIALRTPNGQRFRAWDVRSGHGVLWILGPDGVLRLDPRTNRITKAIALGSGYEIPDAALTGADLWLLRADRRLLRVDAATGRQKHALRAPVTGALQTGELRAVDNTLIVATDDEGADEIAGVDPTTGHTLWRKLLRTAGPSAAADGVLWVPTTEAQHTGIALVGIDPHTGAIRARVLVDREFDAAALGQVGPQLWLTTAAGHAIVIGH
jgi:putative pyrroloquinoline-quinone binding quinoprotein